MIKALGLMVLGALALVCGIGIWRHADRFLPSGANSTQVLPRRSSFAVIRGGLLTPTVHKVLREAWTDDVQQVERAYCGLWHVAYTVQGDTVFVIHGTIPAHFLETTPTQIVGLRCREGTAPIHTHSSSTCVGNLCVAGGVGAFQCFPSPNDIRVFEARRESYPFGVIQCGPDHFVFFQSLLAFVPETTGVKHLR